MDHGAWKDGAVRVVTESKLGAVLGRLPGIPRVVLAGNFATPWEALAVLDSAIARYRLFALNAQVGVPDRDGVILETPFVGPGMRGRKGLRYFPCRLSLVPTLFKGVLPLTWCWCTHRYLWMAPSRWASR